MIRTGQEWHGNFDIFLIFSKLAQEILTLYNLTHLCTNFVLVFTKKLSIRMKNADSVTESSMN